MRVVVSNSMVTWGGGENWSLTAASGLSDRGHEVRIVCRPESVLRERALQAGVDVFPVQLRGDLNPLAIIKLMGFFRRFKPDVIICNVDREVRSLGIAARLSGRIPFIRRRGSDYAFKNALRYRLSYKLLVDRVLVNSRSTMNTILSGNQWMPEAKLRMIYNGIPTSKYCPDKPAGNIVRDKLAIPREAFTAGMMGSFLPRKEHPTLIRAAREIPEMHLLLVGPSPNSRYLESLKELARPLGERVHFTGAVSNTNDYYNAMDVFVMPSSNEGFGYAAAEAMCAGIPVVVSDATSLPEVAGDAGVVFPVGDHDALASALKKMILKDIDTESMSVEGRKRVNTEFSMERMLSRIEEFLREVAGCEA